MQTRQQTMVQAAAGAPNPGETRATQRNAVGDNFDEESRSLVISAAKSAVGSALMSRRAQDTLTLVALLKAGHIQLDAMQDAGVRFEEAIQQYDATCNQEELPRLKWAHLHVWTGLRLPILNGEAVPADAKASMPPRSARSVPISRIR
ncbi:unnamed protein product [Prorocentrum cordatum]|uniref:Uncharacterized protein n=1 Tax=Prorocentrum cordatum TaxID=2364126 RepID=A0ABN9W7Y3_9DINO|nr:unnamed protein product [Polarella glacialis]